MKRAWALLALGALLSGCGAEKGLTPEEDAELLRAAVVAAGPIRGAAETRTDEDVDEIVAALVPLLDTKPCATSDDETVRSIADDIADSLEPDFESHAEAIRAAINRSEGCPPR